MEQCKVTSKNSSSKVEIVLELRHETDRFF